MGWAAMWASQVTTKQELTVAAVGQPKLRARPKQTVHPVRLAAEPLPARTMMHTPGQLSSSRSVLLPTREAQSDRPILSSGQSRQHRVMAKLAVVDQALVAERDGHHITGSRPCAQSAQDAGVLAAGCQVAGSGRPPGPWLRAATRRCRRDPAAI